MGVRLMFTPVQTGDDFFGILGASATTHGVTVAHDLVIRNARIVDGTGSKAFPGDVAIDGDTISAIGTVEEKGREEIDAGGNAATPGFIDLHTHLDAQIGWDPDLTSITWHGVTTALMGNCGVTFAPCRPEDREFLAGMMETVEDIPKRAILSGLPWDWESYGGYLDSVERLSPMINVAGLVGHCATRFYVMGERSVEEPATPEEIRQIAELAGQSIKDGAVGFSTSRASVHRLPDGRCIPGTYAGKDELMAIAAAVGKAGGIMQTVMNFAEAEEEMALIGEGAAFCRAAIFSEVCNPSAERRQRQDETVRRLRAEGKNITGFTVPRSAGGVGGLTTPHFWHSASWNELREMDFEKRLEALRDESFRGKLVTELKEHERADQIAEQTRTWYPMGISERAYYTGSPDESLLAIANKAGEHPAETWIRLTLESDGQLRFHHRVFNHDLDVVAEVISTDWAMPGLGDAGAHVSGMIDAGWATFVLSHWHRDAGLYSLEEAVRRMTSVPADILALADRGTLAVGKKADLNVIDTDRVAECQPLLVNDFPHGAPRFIQRAVGYQATICNGQVILRDDEHTGAHPGQVLRNQG
jgi:N-acyl-D-aspartate/D-glutamate deacylase